MRPVALGPARSIGSTNGNEHWCSCALVFCGNSSQDARASCRLLQELDSSGSVGTLRRLDGVPIVLKLCGGAAKEQRPVEQQRVEERARIELELAPPCVGAFAASHRRLHVAVPGW